MVLEAVAQLQICDKKLLKFLKCQIRKRTNFLVPLSSQNLIKVFQILFNFSIIAAIKVWL